MAEDIQTAELAKTQITNQGILANIGNSLEKIKHIFVDIGRRDF